VDHAGQLFLGDVEAVQCVGVHGGAHPLDGAGAAAAILSLIAAGVAARAAWQCGAATAAIERSVSEQGVPAR
jgi:hypothetical protein